MLAAQPALISRTWSIPFTALVLAALWSLHCAAALAGWIEDRADGVAIIHLTVFKLPDASLTDPFNRAEVAAVREFQRRFPELFRRRCQQYNADPARYGKREWDKVEIELHQSSGIEVEGIETDLLAIAGRMAPDVLFVNFRRSDTYIQQGFLYPLDRHEDGYSPKSSGSLAAKLNIRSM
jgi:multiple sugar transport system permease protein